MSQGINGGGGITNDSGTVILNNSTMAGNSAERGGGIRNLGQPNTNGIYGILIISDSLIQGNTSGYLGTLGDGGGIWNSGTLTMNNSYISDNTSQGTWQGGRGGGIYNDALGTMTLTNIIVTGNSAPSGGGIHNDYGTGSIIDSTISTNVAQGHTFFIGGSYNYYVCGGGITNHQGTLTITGSIISTNTCEANAGGGGIFNNGILTMDQTTITDNYSAGDGGGLSNTRYGAGSLVGSATLTNVLISSNNAQYGGGVSNNFNLSIKSSSISYNIAGNPIGYSGVGGGLYNQGLSPGSVGFQILEDVDFIGNTAYDGGGIYNAGYNYQLPTIAFELIDVAFNSNRAGQYNGGHGGAIANFDSGMITITGSTFNINFASWGGNIYNHGSSVFLFNSSLDHNFDCCSGDGSTIVNNPGNGIDAVFSATDSVFSGAGGFGGFENSSTATFVRSNFFRFGINNSGSLTVSESTFTDNSDKAINNGGQLEVTSSTFNNNQYGIYINNNYNSNGISVINSTFYGNPNAIYNSSPADPLTISNSTFGGGRLFGKLIIRNSIMFDNACADSYPTAIIDGGNNIDTGVACGFSTATGSMSNIGDAQVSPIGDNGGPTKTIALLPGSPAIDAGDNANCPSTDQRGVIRPLDGDGDTNAMCDIGAYEFENTPTGSNVVVQLEETGTGTSPVEMTFAEITQSGTTSLVTSATGPIIPSGFSLGNPPTYYDISTTATFSSVITVCISYTPEEYIDTNNLHLLHYENDAWTDVAMSNDTVNYVICGQVNSLSPFVIAEQVTIPYNFTGFFQPVDNLPTLNVVNAGRAIPLKFSLGGDYGLDIFAAGYPTSTLVACGTTAEDAIEQTVTANASGLTYNTSTGQYTYVWKTDKSWLGTCRTLVVKLNDGTYHRANFKFK